MDHPLSHHILYDSFSKAAVDITAEVKQAPLLSRVQPYTFLDEELTGLLERLISGEEKPIKDYHNQEMIDIPCVIGFESTKLDGSEYIPIRDAMARLKDLNDEQVIAVGALRTFCLDAKIIKEKKE